MKIIHFLYKLNKIMLRKKFLICIVFVIMLNLMVNEKLFLNLSNCFYSGGKLSPKNYLAAENELREDANTHYHTIIGRATIYEIIATVLILINTALTFWLITLSRLEDKI